MLPSIHHEIIVDLYWHRLRPQDERLLRYAFPFERLTNIQVPWDSGDHHYLYQDE